MRDLCDFGTGCNDEGRVGNPVAAAFGGRDSRFKAFEEPYGEREAMLCRI